MCTQELDVVGTGEVPDTAAEALEKGLFRFRAIERGSGGRTPLDGFPSDLAHGRLNL